MGKVNITELEDQLDKRFRDLYEKHAQEYKKTPELFRSKNPVKPDWKMPEVKYSATKHGRKGKDEGKHQPFHEEAVVNVWHEKDVLNVFTMRPGHAALKLSVFNEKEKKNKMVKYISWWPGDGGANKFSSAKPGHRVLDTRRDRYNEMTGDDDVNLLLKLQFIRAAWSKKADGNEDREGKDDFKDLARYQWNGLDDEDQERFKKKYLCRENFSNLAEIPLQIRQGQKFLYKDANDVEESTNLRRVIDAMRSDFHQDSGKPLENLKIIKQPFVRIYVPCACLPAPIIPGDVYLGRSPWGLSIDAMKFKFRSYEEGFRSYKMKGFAGNCIGAVWECLKGGMAEVITDKFRPSKGFVSSLAHFQSLLPSDAIDASMALSGEIYRLNRQQQFLDLLAHACREQLGGLTGQHDCRGGAWRDYVRLRASWTALSSAFGSRPPSLAPIDKLVDRYEKTERLLGKKDSDAVQDLLKLEAVWETRYSAVAFVKDARTKLSSAQKSLDKYEGNLRNSPQNALAKTRRDMFKKRVEEYRALLKQREKSSEPHIKAWEEELEKYEKVRLSRAEILIKLHEAVFDYAFNHACSKPSPAAKPDKRYLAVLLLGQFVCWLFAEVTHDNLAVRFRNIDSDGFQFVIQAREKSLGEAFPNLDVDNRYTSRVLDKDFREASAARDRLLNMG